MSFSATKSISVAPHYLPDTSYIPAAVAVYTHVHGMLEAVSLVHPSLPAALISTITIIHQLKCMIANKA